MTYQKTILPLLVIILVSCGTLRTGEQAPAKPLVAQSPQDIVPQWRTFAPEANEALEYYTGKIIKPRLEFCAVRVDLGAPQLKIFVAQGGSNKNSGGANSGGQAISTKVSSFVRDNNLLAGINALPFEPVSGTEGEYRKNVGIVISDGYVLSPPHPDYDALIFYDDAAPAIVSQSQIVSAVHIANAVGGFFQILADGELSAHTLNSGGGFAIKRHPRSAAGISADGKYLYLCVVDGRHPASIGSTEAETAVILRQLGAWNGINFDGGGSSCLVLRYPHNRVSPLNRPVHKNIPGAERAVAGCIGVALR
ncbi:MAG: phosphodiester glycosidase family protein [Treponema sp.]|nr:phosphodiester glycosidase family protein [Treponema sp.]